MTCFWTTFAPGLESGRVEEGDLRRLLARADRSARPDVAGVLRAAGAIVFLFGLALVFGVGYDGAIRIVVKLVGPFVFPALALAAAIGLHRRGRPRWEVELAGMVGYVALGLAFLTAGVAADAGSGYGLAASAAAIALLDPSRLEPGANVVQKRVILHTSYI